MGNNTEATKHTEKELRKVAIGAFITGAVVGGLVVGSSKDSSAVKEISSAIVKIATSYYGCKFIYEIFH